jgi:ABC-type transport system involved in multi-copper enzyme maturation permease subunit
MTFITLLAVIFLVSVAVCFIVVCMFRKPIDSILNRIISDAISYAWSKYLRFAIYVTGISSGVNLWKIEKYITAPQREGAKVIELTKTRWVLELYRTIIETLQGIAWMLLVFFVFALIAFVIIRVFELKRKDQTQNSQ